MATDLLSPTNLPVAPVPGQTVPLRLARSETDPSPAIDAPAGAGGMPATRAQSDMPVPDARLAEQGRARDGEQPKGEGVASPEQLQQAVERFNEMLRNGRYQLNFQVDQEAGRLVIRVLDAETDELIRQIPSEETLKFAEYVEGLTGLIFNDQA